MPSDQLTIGQDFFRDVGSGVSDIFAGLAASDKIKGTELEAQAYGEAAQLALQNEQFVKQSTAIQEAQQQRELFLSAGVPVIRTAP